MLTGAAILCVGVAVEAAGALVDPVVTPPAGSRGDDAQPARKRAVTNVSTVATSFMIWYFEDEGGEVLYCDA